ncbi:AAA family ATPase [Staphylococcus borealis]|uniref:AAA family ATPase n=2 Tax=Staphylococcus borealis TaxID=2742203 RepID=A0ABX2LMS2_9STAP|nr:AAA family ATPase [Staphylococcus borealis]MUN94804.1 AAA family ATPase [Staphylococcus borealis]NUI79469.1 AAA family ATPase [Staphylococcus borealis]NUI82896.1 AAA family ATPase [Staphylococcus borealis]NUI85538.1 AAA family ATPase [Staphylococcus borealis]NUI91619.1 AAA family ATPase [Staphylococcus borealis]
MKKPILVGKGFRKVSLEKMLQDGLARNNDVVVFDSLKNDVHRCHDGISLEDINIKFRGESSPEETSLETTFDIENSDVIFENLTIDASKLDKNALSINNSNVQLNNVIVKGNDNKVAFFAKENNYITLNSVTIETKIEKEQGGIYLGNSKAFVANSLIMGMRTSDYSCTKIKNTLIVGFISAIKEAQVFANDLYIENENFEYDICARDKGQLTIENLNIISGKSFAQLSESYLSINKVNTNSIGGFTVEIDDFSDAIGEELHIINRDEQTQINDLIEAETTNQIMQTHGYSDLEYDFNEDVAELSIKEYEEAENLLEADYAENEEETNRFEKNNQNESKAIDKLNELIGLEKVKEATKQFINVARINKIKKERGLQQSLPSMHSMFVGNPGTGKTTVARLIARALYEEGVIESDNFIEVSRQDLVSEFVGRTATQTFEILEKAKNGVLFIDEAYTLVNNEGDKGTGQEAIDVILKYMEDYREEIMIIFAGYTNEMVDFINSNPGLSSRIPNTFNFDDYNFDELYAIGSKDLIDKGYEFDSSKYEKVMDSEYKFNFDNSNGRWVRNFNEKLTMQQMQRISESGEYLDNQVLITINNEDFEIFNRQTNEDKETLQSLLNELNNLVGLQNVKTHVNAIVNEVKFNQMLEKQGKSISTSNYHMIFTGSPGTGKTTVARLLAKVFGQLGILSKGHLIETERSEMVGSYIGHTEKNTKRIVEQSLGGVLFIDEAYQLMPKEKSSNDFGIQAIETLITELENKRGKFIAIFAGYENDMERFLESNEGLQSRIPYKIHFDDYAPKEVADIVILALTKDQWIFDEKLLREVVENKYSELDDEKKSNGRWARNFVQELLVVHKSEVINSNDINIDLTMISDQTILNM